MTGGSIARPAGAAIEHRITIAASPAQVWAVLADVDGWGRWNPVYPEAHGRLGTGERLNITIRLPGATSTQHSVATVSACAPGRHLHFGARVFGGLLRATRFIHITPAGPNACEVLNGEAFAGPLGRLAARGLGKRIAEGLRLASEGLKRAAEGEGERS